MTYRDDLQAARHRITELEGEVATLRARLLSRGASAPPARTGRAAAWVLGGVLAASACVGVGAVAIFLGRAQATQHTLEQELHTAQADVAEARAESRLAFELVARAADAQRRNARVPEHAPELEEGLSGAARAREADEGEPAGARPPAEDAALGRSSKGSRSHSEAWQEPESRDNGNVVVVSDRPARIGVDGEAVMGWTPTTLSLPPGPRTLNVIAADGESRQHVVRVLRGHTQRLVVHFD